MYVKKIFLKNYRNLTDTLFDLEENINVLTGNNGQGKTNFLESLYLLGTGSSHRTNRDRELIAWPEERALVQIMLERRDHDLKISLTLDGNGKSIEINNNPVEKVSDLIGNLNVVLFSPEDLDLVKGGPAERRKFLDIEVSQVSPYYYHLLQRYNHILKQRNTLLKEMHIGRGREEMLPIWNEKMIESGSKIIKKRVEVIEKLKILARLTQRQLTDGSENLYLEYDCNLSALPGKEGDVEEAVRLIFKQDLANNRDREIERGYTLVGPHLDDLILKINEIDVRKFGSQGQQRTTALALKLAELEFMKSETGEYPVLLLDDVFSELDKKRCRTLLNIITEKIQTFITTTELNNLGNLQGVNYRLFRVEDGKINEER